MAKLGARGAYEVAKVRGVRDEEDGPTVYLFALRSDGAILRRLVSYANPDGSIYKVSSGYSIAKKVVLKPTNGAAVDHNHPLNVLSLYVESLGLRCEKAGR